MLGRPAWSDLQKENAKNEQARKGTQNYARDFQPLVYHDVQIVWINAHYFQAAPIVVSAANLSPSKSSPSKSPSNSSYVSMNQKHEMQMAFLANSNSKVLIPPSFENGYQNLGLLLEALPKCRLEFQILSPSEAIQESFFNPVDYPDPRFKLAQPSSGSQAWIFTSSRSKKYWVEQCREGIEYANSIMAASCPFFTPINPKCPLVERLILDTSFLGESIVLGARRWYALVSFDFDLEAEAKSSRILKFNARPLNPSSPPWHPLSFAASTARLAILFLACVWKEASCSNNTCFDWETSADLLDWILKSSLKFKMVREGDRKFGLKTVEWARATANLTIEDQLA